MSVIAIDCRQDYRVFGASVHEEQWSSRIHPSGGLSPEASSPTTDEIWLQSQGQRVAEFFKDVNSAILIADELSRPADSLARCRLRSASSSTVRRTRLATVGDRSYPVAASRVWTLEQSSTARHHVTFPSSL